MSDQIRLRTDSAAGPALQHLTFPLEEPAAKIRQQSSDSFESIPLDSPKEERAEITERQKEIFLNIYTILENRSAFAILSQKSRLEALGREVENVCPIHFLQFLKETERLKRSLRILEEHSHEWPYVLKRFSPWRRTVQDFSEKLAQQIRHGSFAWFSFLESFEIEERQRLEKNVAEKNFEELLKFFLK